MIIPASADEPLTEFKHNENQKIIKT